MDRISVERQEKHRLNRIKKIAANLAVSFVVNRELKILFLNSFTDFIGEITKLALQSSFHCLLRNIYSYISNISALQIGVNNVCSFLFLIHYD